MLFKGVIEVGNATKPVNVKVYVDGVAQAASLMTVMSPAFLLDEHGWKSWVQKSYGLGQCDAADAVLTRLF